MPDHSAFRGFTKFFGKQVNKLITSVKLLPITSLNKTLRNTPIEITALWDTGATLSCIRPDLRDRLGLQMVRTDSSATISGIGGMVKADYTIATVFLTHNLAIEYCPLYVLDFPKSFDIVIGMDIIRMGDFAVCNKENKTSFSFILPPLPDRIDFLKTAKNI